MDTDFDFVLRPLKREPHEADTHFHKATTGAKTQREYLINKSFIS